MLQVLVPFIQRNRKEEQLQIIYDLINDKILLLRFNKNFRFVIKFYINHPRLISLMIIGPSSSHLKVKYSASKMVMLKF